MARTQEMDRLDVLFSEQLHRRVAAEPAEARLTAAPLVPAVVHPLPERLLASDLFDA